MSRHRTLQALAVLVGVIGLAFVLGVPVRTQGNDNPKRIQIVQHKGHQASAGEVLVRFRDDARNVQLEPDFDVDQDEMIADGSVRRIHSRSHNIDTLVARLAARPDVLYAEPNYAVYAYETLPNDPYFNVLWGLKNVGQTVQAAVGTPGADIEATLAWDTTRGSRDNIVAVVDTGIDYTHPDLGANVWQAASPFSVTIGGQVVTCPSGSHGFNALTKSCDPLDDNGHGTHVSGTIGASGNNASGVVGVNWIASVMGLKFLNAQGSGTTADAVNAIEFAIQAKQIAGLGANVRVLSNSWGGGGFSQTLLNEINKANANEMAFVAAAGNSGTNNDATPNYPSSYAVPNIVAVAATDSNDRLASFSNYGATTVELGAPGVNIISTYPGGRYAYMSGTSMATPHVSGAAALMLAACGSSTTTSTLIGALLGGVEKISSLAGVTTTGGRLNVNRAIIGCAGVPPPPPTSDFTFSATPASASVARRGSATFTVSVEALNGFTGPVSFGVSGLPAGSTGSFLPLTVTTSGNSTLTVKTTSSTKPASYGLTITGTSGTLAHSTKVTLTVTR